MAATTTQQQQQQLTTPTSLTISSQSDPALQKLLTGVWGESPSSVPLLALYFPCSSSRDAHKSYHDEVKALYERQQQSPSQSNSNSRREKRLFDLVYVSSDSTEQEMFENLEDGWLYVPFAKTEQRRSIKHHFGVNPLEQKKKNNKEDHHHHQVPTLIIIDKQRDVVLTTKGMEDIIIAGMGVGDGGEGDGDVAAVDPLTKWRHLLSESNLED